MAHTHEPPHILGIDPGFASFGWAEVSLVDTPRILRVGVIRTQPSDKKRKVLEVEDNVRRAIELWNQLYELVFDPVIIGAEAMSHPRNASSAYKVAFGWGVLLGLVGDNVQILQMSPQDIKKHLCKKKTASKKEVQAAIERTNPELTGLLREADFPPGQYEHACDAAGAALACAASPDVASIKRTLKRVLS